MRKDPGAVEFDRRRGEAGMAIAELMEEFGIEPVRAAMMDSLRRQYHQDERQSFIEQFHSDE